MARLYFIKLNVSAEVFDMKANKDEILTEIFQALTTVNYTMEIEYVYEEDENTKYVKQQEYELEIKDIENTLLVADFIRLTHVPINKKNEKTREIYPTPTETYEPIRFIVDIKKEIIAFYTKQRFGYRQFQKYFEQYLNNIIYLYKNKQDYINVDDDEIKYVILKLITTNYDIEEFKLLLETKGNVKNLGYSFIFPNGNEDLINGVNECTEGLIDKYKEAQINEVNEEIISNTEKGLLIQSQPVNEFFEDIKKLKKD